MERQIVEKYVTKLNDIAEKAVKRGQVDKACMAISVSAGIQYEWNQDYTDEFLETQITRLIEVFQDRLPVCMAEANTVLFYDSFGLDTRGLALIYLKALCDLGYRVLYIVPPTALNRQPEIKRQTAGKGIIFHYLENTKGQRKIRELLKIFSGYRPERAFFYTMPNDIEACVAFGCLGGMAVRYQINLTDHAFWLGLSAFDYCVEFREYGACISHEYRGIAAEKLQLLPFYPYVNANMSFEGFPFEAQGKKVVFSGGGLYKTIDEQGTYYSMVGKMLTKHPDTVFLYAGSGDKSHMLALQAKFPGRVFLIAERKDLYALMKHCTLYLNTYPLIGGLMTQYAAIAGKVPVTLVRYVDCSLDGLILGHEDMRAEFGDSEELLAEIDRLLDDEEYRRHAEEKLKDSVMTDARFKEELQRLLTEGKTSFTFDLHHQDTTEFRSHYVDRFTKDKLAAYIINKRTKTLWWHFPQLFWKQVVGKMKDI